MIIVQDAGLMAQATDSRVGAPPVYGGVLIGGSSSRMGRPKQLLQIGGRTILSGIIDALRSSAEKIVLLGEGPVPADLGELERLSDVSCVHGPLGGILAASRWAPYARWIIVGCDYPWVHRGALEWLLAQAGPDHWAVLPRRVEDAPPEPLLALYEPASGSLLADLTSGGAECGPARLANHPRTYCPVVPLEYRDAWTDVDRPSDLGRNPPAVH